MKPTLKTSRPAKSIEVARTTVPVATASPLPSDNGASMSYSNANVRRGRWPVQAVTAMIPGQSPVRMDGECLLQAGGEPLHGPFSSHLPEESRFAASHIEPIESEA